MCGGETEVSTTHELHNEAMDCAELAVIARLGGDHARADTLFARALELEQAALEALPVGVSVEPTKSILLRSAATLALDCNDSLLAERLVARGLAEGAQGAIVDELRDLMEQVHFRRHLELRGITLSDDELQMSLAGEGVGFGVVNSADFLQRVDDTSRMVYRIVERGVSCHSGGKTASSCASPRSASPPSGPSWRRPAPRPAAAAGSTSPPPTTPRASSTSRPRRASTTC